MCECDSVCCEHTKEVTLCETYLDVELVENRGRYLNATKSKNRNSNIHVGTHFYLVTLSSRRWCVWVCRVCVGGVGSRGVWVTKSNDKQIKVDKTFVRNMVLIHQTIVVLNLTPQVYTIGNISVNCLGRCDLDWRWWYWASRCRWSSCQRRGNRPMERG